LIHLNFSVAFVDPQAAHHDNVRLKFEINQDVPGNATYGGIVWLKHS